MIEEIKNQVSLLLDKDQSGHGMDHINRVLDLSLKFALDENANLEIVSLIALLHDVDDYKLFGMDFANHLTNAKKIMNTCLIAENIQEQVCDALKKIGYSKRLKGCIPESIEAKVVSDADMCDGMGVNGILRVYAYSLKIGRSFFDKNIFPNETMNYHEYVSNSVSTGVCHIFEKILKLKSMMLTKSGRLEAEIREKIVIDFLYQLFREENADEWKNYLDHYLDRRNKY